MGSAEFGHRQPEQGQMHIINSDYLLERSLEFRGQIFITRRVKGCDKKQFDFKRGSERVG
jgi:hypothetical protein